MSEKTTIKPPADLTEKQKKFCREYIREWNATRSYLIAYPNTKSENTAAVEAHKLLRKPNVKSYIIEIQDDLEKTAGISRLKVLEEHMKLAFNSIAHMHDTWVDRKVYDQLTDDQKACIKSIESSKELKNIGGKTAANQKFIEVETVKITLYDKQKALDSISKMLGYDAPQKINLSGGITTAVEIVFTDFNNDRQPRENKDSSIKKV
jgi:phage terminase small subunit